MQKAGTALPVRPAGHFGGGTAAEAAALAEAEAVAGGAAEAVVGGVTAALAEGAEPAEPLLALSHARRPTARSPRERKGSRMGGAEHNRGPGPPSALPSLLYPSVTTPLTALSASSASATMFATIAAAGSTFSTRPTDCPA